MEKFWILIINLIYGSLEENKMKTEFYCIGGINM